MKKIKLVSTGHRNTITSGITEMEVLQAVSSMDTLYNRGNEYLNQRLKEYRFTRILFTIPDGHLEPSNVTQNLSRRFIPRTPTV